jgi:hypothetical protein
VFGRIGAWRKATPTATPATTRRFLSSHSSPAWTHPFSLMTLLRSPICRVKPKQKWHAKPETKKKQNKKAKIKINQNQHKRGAGNQEGD